MPTLIDELTAAYNDKLADLELEKNLQGNYLEVTRTLHQINTLIDIGRLTQEEMLEFMVLAYQYYRLLESYMQAMVKEDQDNSEMPGQ